MSENEPTCGPALDRPRPNAELDGRFPGDPVTVHELMFGRESTTGYLVEQGEECADVVEACADRVARTPFRRVPEEQSKPGDPLRV